MFGGLHVDVRQSRRRKPLGETFHLLRQVTTAQLRKNIKQPKPNSDDDTLAFKPF